MENYTLGLAFFDYIPVFLSGAGLFYLANWLVGEGADSRLTKLGAFFIFLGGFSKATWKLRDFKFRGEN